MRVTAPSPDTRVAGRLGSRKARRKVSLWLAVPLSLLLAGGGYATWQLTRAGATAATSVSTVTVSRGTLTASVSGSGTVDATSSRTLAFTVAGTVEEVLVSVGDAVTKGQPIARLNTTDLQLALQQAEANLVSAQAQVAANSGEGATPEEIAAAEAQLRSARAQYPLTATGGTTASDLASARAQFASAQAQLDDFLDGPTAAELAAAEEGVAQAERTLQSQRASLASAKARAESQMITAANSLRDAQDSYSTIYWQNRQLEKAPGDLPQANQDSEAAAERAVANAEESYKQAQLTYEQAKQDEIIGLQQAEADVVSARRDLETVQDGATDAEIASARASVASAQANLANLEQGGSVEERAIAQASVEQAQISLDQLTKPDSDASIASAAAGLALAEVALAQARQDLEDATLLAPFDGVVAEVLVATGDTASSATTITVVDPTDLYVELSLSESDVVGVVAGQAVALTFDALPDAAITGTVAAVAPVATVASNVATYLVRVSFDPGDQPIKAGMTVSGTIVTEEHANVLLVPSRAVQSRDDAGVVQVQQGVGQPAVSVRVETGLSSDGQIEILGCVDTSSQCLQEGDTLLVAAATSSAGSSTQSATGGLGAFGPGAGGPPPEMGR